MRNYYLSKMSWDRRPSLVPVLTLTRQEWITRPHPILGATREQSGCRLVELFSRDGQTYRTRETLSYYTADNGLTLWIVWRTYILGVTKLSQSRYLMVMPKTLTKRWKEWTQHCYIFWLLQQLHIDADTRGQLNVWLVRLSLRALTITI